jgi:hypothetical protein
MLSEQETWNLIQEEVDRWHSSDGVTYDSLQLIKYGDVLGRTLKQYVSILNTEFARTVARHSSQPSGNIRYVDAGAASCVALMDLRKLLPNAQLIGVDIRNALKFRLLYRNRQYPVSDLISQNRIAFIQTSYTELSDIMPDGYDVLTSVGSFLMDDDHWAVRAEVLRRFHEGLRAHGKAFIVFGASGENLTKMSDSLTSMRIHHSFTPCNPTVREREGLDFKLDHVGTLVLYKYD